MTFHSQCLSSNFCSLKHKKSIFSSLSLSLICQKWTASVLSISWFLTLPTACWSHLTTVLFFFSDQKMKILFLFLFFLFFVNDEKFFGFFLHIVYVISEDQPESFILLFFIFFSFFFSSFYLLLHNCHCAYEYNTAVSLVGAVLLALFGFCVLLSTLFHR